MKTSVSMLSVVAAGMLSGLSASALAGSFTLQHGVGGYLGCQDSYVTTTGLGENSTVNYGLDPNLRLGAEHYNGG